MVFDEARGVTLLFGGHVASGELLGDTWEWDGARWSFRSDSGPTPRVAHAMAYDAARGLVWLSGGIDRRGIDTFQTGTWSWDGWSWTLAPASDPPPHFGSELFFDVRRRTLALVGGWGPLDVPLNEIMEWDGTVWNRSPIPSLPKIEGSAQIIYDSRADQPLLFAMTKRDAPIPAEVWRLGDSQWTKTQTAELSTRD
jgi:hypothetical protein